jgi:hypothetical protein
LSEIEGLMPNAKVHCNEVFKGKQQVNNDHYNYAKGIFDHVTASSFNQAVLVSKMLGIHVYLFQKKSRCLVVI